MLRRKQQETGETYIKNPVEVCMGLVGFSWLKSNPAVTCQISRLRAPRARATEPDRAPNLHRGVLAGPLRALCPAAESARKHPRAPEKVSYSAKNEGNKSISYIQHTYDTRCCCCCCCCCCCSQVSAFQINPDPRPCLLVRRIRVEKKKKKLMIEILSDQAHQVPGNLEHGDK